jgi:hypothetical protein
MSMALKSLWLAAFATSAALELGDVKAPESVGAPTR